jgi:glycosyltransferase involved in cell wall biosynthesis
VIIGVKNGAAVLQHCLDSIAAQQGVSREVIVVDSASVDGTRELLEENLRAGKASTYVSEPDGGLYEAWNKGLQRSHGDWICFLGCDDKFHDAGALRALLDAAAAAPGRPRVVHGRLHLVAPGGAVAVRFGRPWAQARDAFLAGTMIPHPGLLHHRSLFEDHGLFDESYRVAGDYEMLLRELVDRDALFVDRLIVEMAFGGMSSKPGAIYRTLHEIKRARATHGLTRTPARLRMALAAAWLGNWILRILGERAYRWSADLYRVARGKPRIWTA